eukprot:CAMPEP_0113481122 /NCGR_PEP_ID=MMETSP0014_2-20120614/22243_1 /TAXON_ID=2857 /ORGANISM="Nitzschia sp." /LENGTH=754 /DNA_ID=CAMNT_0000374603 /DNA_START=234 /DNA_END=2499 /DNA_ORIENTATION=+ /assembly_acc=CAM_ASM_000159
MASWFRRSDSRRGQHEEDVSTSWENSRGPVEVHRHGAEPVVISFDETGDADSDEADYQDDHGRYHPQQLRQQQQQQRQQEAGQIADENGPAYNQSSRRADENISPPALCAFPTHHVLLEPDDVGSGRGEEDFSKKNDRYSLAPSARASARAVPVSRELSPNTISQMRDMDPIRDGSSCCCGGGGKKSGNCTRRRLVVTTLLCVLIAILILVTVLTVNKNQSQSSNVTSDGSGSAAGESTNSNGDSEGVTTIVVDFSERAMMIQGLLTETSVESLADLSTGPGQALKWLADEDTAMVDPDTSTSREIQERFAVSALFFATMGEEWDDTLNFLSEESVCNWNDGQSLGVFCDESGIVTSLNIVENGLDGGPIPSDLNYLVGLEELNLYYNSITGDLPSLHKLEALEKIDLDGNLLTGTVPESIFSLPELKNLFLLNNENLGGTIPDFREGSAIESASFFGCSFSGTIPSTIGLVSNLRFFQMKDNNLSGSIPPQLFTDLPALETVGLAGNRLTGSIPPFVNTVNLKTLSLGQNRFESLPAAGSDLYTLPTLESLYLHSNSIQGPFPQDLVDLPSLRQLWLQDNRLTGSIDLSSLSETIEDIFLGRNAGLEGNLPFFLQTVPPSTLRIDLSETKFVGSISSSISRFSSLQYFNVSFCDITGSLPTNIGSLVDLETFGVAGNNLSGEIPVEIGSLRQLVALDLSRNPNLTGDLSPTCEVVLDSDGNIPDGVSLVSDVVEVEVFSKAMLNVCVAQSAVT